MSSDFLFFLIKSRFTYINYRVDFGPMNFLKTNSFNIFVIIYLLFTCISLNC